MKIINKKWQLDHAQVKKYQLKKARKNKQKRIEFLTKIAL